MTEQVSHLDLLDRVCRQKNWALLLTAHHVPAAFSTKARTELRHLDVIEPGPGEKWREQLVAGELVGRVSIDPLELNLETGAEALLEALYRNELVERGKA